MGRQQRAVRNTLEILAEVVTAGPGVTARDISSALGLPRATTYRLLNQLVAEEYLVRMPDLSGFALGTRAARLSAPVNPPLSTAARTVVSHLRSRTRWGVHLASYTTGKVVIADPDPDQPPSPAHLLAANPHVSALGKLLLSEAPTSQNRPQKLTRFTEHTRVSSSALRTDLDSVARSGLATQRGELYPERGCLAVPVRSPTDSSLIAGLALSGPAHRIAEPQAELVNLLREHATQLGPLLA